MCPSSASLSILGVSGAAPLTPEGEAPPCDAAAASPPALVMGLGRGCPSLGAAIKGPAEEGRSRVISGFQTSVRVDVGSALRSEHGPSYQHQSWYLVALIRNQHIHTHLQSVESFVCLHPSPL